MDINETERTTYSCNDGVLTVNYSNYHIIPNTSILKVWKMLREIREKKLIKGVAYNIELLEGDRIGFSGSRSTESLPTLIKKIIESVMGDVFSFHEDIVMKGDNIEVKSSLSKSSNVFLIIKTTYYSNDSDVKIHTRIKSGVRSTMATYMSKIVSSLILSSIKKKVKIVRDTELAYISL